VVELHGEASGSHLSRWRLHDERIGVNLGWELFEVLFWRNDVCLWSFKLGLRSLVILKVMLVFLWGCLVGKLLRTVLEAVLHQESQ
jgi:hypothetical protein